MHGQQQDSFESIKKVKVLSNKSLGRQRARWRDQIREHIQNRIEKEWTQVQVGCLLGDRED